MEMRSLEGEQRIHEFHFEASTLHAEVCETGREDLRTRWQRWTLRKPPEVKAAWDVKESHAAFRCPGGVLADGELWTTPIEIPPVPQRVVAGYFTLLEKRGIGGPPGRQVVTAHLRDEAVIGPAKDLAAETLVLHEADAGADGAWHAHTVDLMGLVGSLKERRGVFLTFEISVSASTPAKRSGTTEFAFQRLGAVFHLVHPASREA